MSQSQKIALASQSASFKKLNPQMFGGGVTHGKIFIADGYVKDGKEYFTKVYPEAKRVRQGEPPLRKWEDEWKARVEMIGVHRHVRAQSLRYRLANGSWFKPDVTAIDAHEQQICWEVKGGSKMKGVAKGIMALKVAATTYPEIIWVLVWKEQGEWKNQVIEP